MAYCRESRTGAYQWCDSKVVNCVSLYLTFDVGMVKRHVGSEQKKFPSCPSAIIHYQGNMGGVDKGDQIRSHFGGFAAQSHFKKWYKKTLMAILDCMLLNTWKLWNMSVGKVPGRERLERHIFFQVICEELLKYKTEQLVSPLNSPAPAATNRPIGDRLEHNPCYGSNIIESEDERRCVVCGLEARQFVWFGEKMAKLRPKDRDKIKQRVEEAGRKGHQKESCHLPNLWHQCPQLQT